MRRQVTVLGTCGGWPEPGRAGSGFLVEYDGFRLVLDLGYAVFPRLLRHCGGDAGRIDAVAVTHAHPDHCADLSALARARYFAPGPRRRIPLYCPPGVVERVQAMEPTEDLGEVFEVHPLPGRHQAGPFLLEGVPLPHHVPHCGIRLAAPGAVLAYTGDAGADPALAALGADADLLVAGVTVQESGGGIGAPGPQAELLSAGEAGWWAARVRARRLLLTHFWPGSDRGAAIAHARAALCAAALGGPDGRAATAVTADVVAAEEDLVVPLPAEPPVPEEPAPGRPEEPLVLPPPRCATRGA